ncbi:hypothetical protein [Pseudomonas syringae]|uniref:hypothetical protein n=1 Tax=Pseudomonas syringae TaxID=317 RepID=UPI00067EBC53|nr:hypothetical protein [Pseudomonas syringae]
MLLVKVAIFDFVSDQAVKKPLPMLLIAQRQAARRPAGGQANIDAGVFFALKKNPFLNRPWRIRAGVAE